MADWPYPPHRDKERPEEYLSGHYVDLPNYPGAIRILKLRPSTKDNLEIDCSLIIPRVDDEGNLISPKYYEALSWCWGTDEKSEYIRITQGEDNDERTFAKSVSPTLYSALRALRYPYKNRYLWIDAICINQDNLDEKNSQVEQMDKIYGNAFRVCIWLGDEEESSKIAIDFIKNEVMKLQNFDQLCASPEANSKWQALLSLMQRDWFSRRWVVQEIALARSALIYCGPDNISWNKFAVAVELFVEVETATHRFSEVMRDEMKTKFVPRLFEYVKDLGASLLVDATGKLFPDYRMEERGEDDPFSRSIQGLDMPTDGKYFAPTLRKQTADNLQPYKRRQENNQAPLLSLEYLVSSLSVFETTVPHDSIYALLAISKDTTPAAPEITVKDSANHAKEVLEIFMQRKRYNVDYKLPYVDVCKDFIMFCITRSVQVDKSRALDVICRPWATEQKKLDARKRTEKSAKERKERERLERRGYEYAPNDKEAQRPGLSEDHKDEPVSAEQQDMTLPSWVPQLSEAPFAMYPQPGMEGIKMSRSNADSLVGLPSTVRKNYTAAETKGVDMKALKFRKRCSLDHFSMYIRGFVLDTIDTVAQLSRNGQIPEEWAALADWHEAEGDPPDAFWRTLVANRGKDGGNPPVYYARACKECFMKGGYRGGAVDTGGLMTYERNSIVAQFCRRVQAVTWNRALAKTKADSKLGLVGKNVRNGDLVCILYGCSVPVILRRSLRKTEGDFEKELEWEREFLTATLKKYIQRWQRRVTGHKLRKEKFKREFYKWELQKCKEWIEGKEQRFPIQKQRELMDALKREQKASQDLDEAIEKARLVAEETQRDADKIEANSKQEDINGTESRPGIKRRPQSWMEEKLTAIDPSNPEYIDSKKKNFEDLQARHQTIKSAAVQLCLDQEWLKLIEKEAASFTIACGAERDYTVAIGSNGAELDEGTGELKKISDEANFRWTKLRATVKVEYKKRLLQMQELRKMERMLAEAEKRYNLAKDGRNIQFEETKADLQEQARLARRHYEKLRASRKYYIQVLHEVEPVTDPLARMEPMRLFNKFKHRAMKKEIEEAKKEEAKKDAKREKRNRPFPLVDWQEFELSLKYGRLWLENHHAKRNWSGRRYSVFRDARRQVHTQTVHSNSATENGFYRAQAPEKCDDIFYDDRDDSDWDDDTWKEKTDGLYQSLRELNRKRTALEEKKRDPDCSDEDWIQYSASQKSIDREKEQIKDKWKDENWGLYRQREKAKKKKSGVERLGMLIVEGGRLRWRLTDVAKEKYNKKIKKNLREKLGHDGFWSYEFLGECYIHSMMDGEAMAFQNGKGQDDATPTTVFELR